MQKFVGVYAVYLQKTLDNKASKNKHDNYLKHKTGQVYRYNSNTLVLYLNSTNSRNKYLPLLQESKVKIIKIIEADSEYQIYFSESQLDIVAKIVKVQQKGKHKYPNFE